jgi:tight adherence protein B
MAGVAAAGLVMLGGGAARADDQVTVGVSGVTVTTTTSGTTVTGVMTLRSRDAVQIDPAKVQALVDGTTYPVTVKQAAKKERKAMLLIDTSGSMGAAGMATVRTAAAQYLRSVPADVKVGVASFANTAGVDLAPTLNRAAAQRVINGLASRGNTSLYGGVLAAIRALGGTGDRSIVLLSDGADTVAKDELGARRVTVAAVKSAGVRIDVVRFKTNDPDATAALTSFAGANGGSVVPAADTAAVAAAFLTAAKALDQQVQFSVALPDTKAGPHLFQLKGKVGTAGFGFGRTVDFGAASTPTATPSTTVASAPPGALDSVASLQHKSWTPWIAAGLLGLAMLVLVGSLVAPTLQTKREQRVAAIETYVAGSRSQAREDARAAQSHIADSLLNLGDRVMQDRKSTKTTMALIDRADLPFRAGEWFVLRGVAVVVAAVIGLFVGGQNPLIGSGVGALLGLLLPPVVLKFMASRRANAFERQLPDVLTLVATSLRSGFGLPQALDAVARDAAEPAAKEFSRSLAETRIGTDITDALERMGDRMDSTSMRWTVMSIRIQRDVGGNLADTLRTTAATLRERESIHRQVRTLSAEGRLSAYVLIGLPIFLFLYLFRTNYDYLSLLWTTTMGMFMLAGGLVALLVGIVWMRNVVKIEV